MAAFPRPAIPRADFQKPAMKKADSQKLTKTAPTKDCTHITAIGWGAAAVQPTAPESRNRHGYRAPYGPAIPRPAWHCSRVDLDVTHDRRQYGP